ncbi:MAG: tRNA (adenosine(37)-N6)-threonylcarbamoyltransferase complex dimerization subunit type 1 TsaB [Gemmatimonadaceae bacterium]
MNGTLTLAIDASTYRGTVAVLAGSDVVATSEVAMRGEREERLMPAIAAALGSAGISTRDLGRVVVGGGPGSFTSLRIGAALAKGICVARGIPLAAMPSLALLVAGGASPVGDGRFLTILDAMRGDVYTALVETRDGLVIAVSGEHLLPHGQVGDVAARLGARIVGGGNPPDAMPHARGLARLDASLVTEVALESWEPDYGRLAEAQVKWEAQHGRPLTTG